MSTVTWGNDQGRVNGEGNATKSVKLHSSVLQWVYSNFSITVRVDSFSSSCKRKWSAYCVIVPGPRYGSPPSPTGSLSEVASSLYSHGASLSPRESDTEARERTPRSHFYSHNEHCPTVTVSCESLMEELNETEKFPVIIHENKCKHEVVISDPELSNFQGSSFETFNGRVYRETPCKGTKKQNSYKVSM